MAEPTGTADTAKISPQLRQRLDNLGAGDTITAIVMIRTPHHDQGPEKRRERRTEKRLPRLARQALAADVIEAARAALGEIDDILAHHDGERLGEPNALAAIPVETTRAGILALAESRHVTAIVEEQPAQLLR